MWGDIMFELTKEEIKSLLDINEKILFKIKQKRATCIYNIIYMANRDHSLLELKEKELTNANKEELESFDSKIEDTYTKLNPLTNQCIYHGEIKRILSGKASNHYINPLEVYKYYISRSNRITLIKLFMLVSKNNAKFVMDDVSTLASCEILMSTNPNAKNMSDTTLVNIFSNYLAALETEYQKQATNLIDIKSVNRINKQLIATLENYLIENKASYELTKTSKKLS